VAHAILLLEQIEALNRADLAECEGWLALTTGWGADSNTVENGETHNKRLMVSGDPRLDAAIVAQHNLYKGTGSIEAQAR
jgi:hypothetical protein